MAVNFQYQTYVHERRYQRTALFLYAAPQFAALACCALSRTRPEGLGTDEIVVDISDQPLSLRPSTQGSPYGSTRRGQTVALPDPAQYPGVPGTRRQYRGR